MKNKFKYYKNMIMGKRGDNDAMILPELPPDIIYEILVNVPPYYLQQLRLVCKSWKNMFSTTNFILDNFARMKPDFLLQPYSPIWRRHKIYGMEIDEKHLNYKIHDEIKLGCGPGKFISSCYGVVLMKKKYVLKVLNLATRHCLTLPESPSRCPHKITNFNCTCGLALGFDPYKNVFKVVHIYDDGYGFEIFTIGDSCWKQIPVPWKHEFLYLDTGLSINNGRFLHWNVLSSEFVLSMDVCDDKIMKLQLPNIGKTINEYFYRLLELGGHLSLAYYSSCTRIEIWILEDFGSNLWFKKHTIKAERIDYIVPAFKNKLPDFLGFIIFGATSNGVLVFKYEEDGRVYFYDIAKKRMKKCKSRVDLMLHRSSLFKLQQT